MLSSPSRSRSEKRAAANRTRELTSLHPELAKFLDEDELDERSQLQRLEDLLWKRLVNDFQVEAVPFKDLAIAKLQLKEARMRMGREEERAMFMERFHAFFLGKTAESRIPGVVHGHKMGAALIWMAETVCRSETYRRLNVIKSELTSRAEDLDVYYRRAFVPSHLLPLGSEDAHYAALWEQHRAKLAALRLERARGYFAAKLAELINVHEASRYRIEWEEESVGNELRDVIGSQLRKLKIRI